MRKNEERKRRNDLIVGMSMKMQQSHHSVAVQNESKKECTSIQAMRS